MDQNLFVRFVNIKEIFERFKMERDNLKDEIKTLKEKIQLADVKIDDLENRSQRKKHHHIQHALRGGRL